MEAVCRSPPANGYSDSLNGVPARRWEPPTATSSNQGCSTSERTRRCPTSPVAPSTATRLLPPFTGTLHRPFPPGGVCVHLLERLLQPSLEPISPRYTARRPAQRRNGAAAPPLPDVP